MHLALGMQIWTEVEAQQNCKYLKPIKFIKVIKKYILI